LQGDIKTGLPFREGLQFVYVTTKQILHLPYGWRLIFFVCFVFITDAKVAAKAEAAKSFFKLVVNKCLL